MRRRTAVTLALVLMMAIVGVLVVQSARAWGFTTDRHKRGKNVDDAVKDLNRQGPQEVDQGPIPLARAVA